jgi:hypothetical protein
LLHWRNFWIPAWVTKTSLNPWPFSIRPSDVRPFAATRRRCGREGGTEPSELARTVKRKENVVTWSYRAGPKRCSTVCGHWLQNMRLQWFCPRCWKCCTQKDPFRGWSVPDGTADKMTTRHDEIYSQYPPLYIHVRQITDFEIFLDYSPYI